MLSSLFRVSAHAPAFLFPEWTGVMPAAWHTAAYAAWHGPFGPQTFVCEYTVFDVPLIAPEEIEVIGPEVEFDLEVDWPYDLDPIDLDGVDE